MGKKQTKKHKAELPPSTEAPQAEQDDLLAVLIRAKEAVEENQAVIEMGVGAARKAGVTWPQIGSALGVTAQAAQQRYGSRPPLSGAEPSATRLEL